MSQILSWTIQQRVFATGATLTLFVNMMKSLSNIKQKTSKGKPIVKRLCNGQNFAISILFRYSLLFTIFLHNYVFSKITGTAQQSM